MSELHDLLDAFIRAKGRQYVSDKQISAVERECRRIIDYIPATSPQEVDKEDVELFLDHLGETGRSARTQNKYLTSIKGLFRWAEIEDKVERNPLRGLRPRKGPQVRVRQVFNADQMRRIAASALNGPRWQPLAIALGYYAGMRLREVKGLQWGRVLFDQDLIELRPQDQKGKKHSFIPMRQELKAMLESAHTEAEDTTPDAIVLPDMPASPSFHHRTMIKRAGIAYVDSMGRVADFHALRHTCLDTMGRSGIPLAYIQDFARHAKPETTRLYVRVNQDGMRQASSCLPSIG